MNIQFFGLSGFVKKRGLLLFCRRACDEIFKKRVGEICVVFVSDKNIRKVNKSFLRHDYATDVIAFPYLALADHEPGQPFGDIYVSVDTAKKVAVKGKYSVVQETALLIVHGMLHLAGYDDHSPQDKKKMFLKQTDLFRKINSGFAPPDVL